MFLCFGFWSVSVFTYVLCPAHAHLFPLVYSSGVSRCLTRFTFIFSVLLFLYYGIFVLYSPSLCGVFVPSSFFLLSFLSIFELPCRLLVCLIKLFCYFLDLTCALGFFSWPLLTQKQLSFYWRKAFPVNPLQTRPSLYHKLSPSLQRTTC